MEAPIPNPSGLSIADFRPVSTRTALIIIKAINAAYGSGGGGYVVVPFTFQSVSPYTVVALPAGSTLFSTEILITEPFSDSSSSLLVGTTLSGASSIFEAGEVDPTYTNTTFGNDSVFTFSSDDSLILTISPGSSTQGSGCVLYSLSG